MLCSRHLHFSAKGASNSLVQRGVANSRQAWNQRRTLSTIESQPLFTLRNVALELFLSANQWPIFVPRCKVQLQKAPSGGGRVNGCQAWNDASMCKARLQNSAKMFFKAQRPFATPVGGLLVSRTLRALRNTQPAYQRLGRNCGLTSPENSRPHARRRHDFHAR